MKIITSHLYLSYKIASLKRRRFILMEFFLIAKNSWSGKDAEMGIEIPNF